jgi:hypothetical protein
MARKTKWTNEDGTQEDATYIDMIETVERWSDIKLEDGSVLKVKATPTAVHRLDSQKSAAGRPVYTVNTQIITILTDEVFEYKK